MINLEAGRCAIHSDCHEQCAAILQVELGLHFALPVGGRVPDNGGAVKVMEGTRGRVCSMVQVR